MNQHILPKKVRALFPDSMQKKLCQLRYDLHQYPELSWTEHRTHDRLKKELETCRPTHIDTVAGTGLVATFKGTDPRLPSLVVRGDIDALPIQEETALPYASQHPGIMHACGHDVHAAWTVGVGHLLHHYGPQARTVYLLLQPAEEISEGAKKVLASQVLQSADSIIGGHVDRRYPIPTVICHPGPISAASDRFEVTIKGKSAHGARPEEGHDSAPVLAQFIEGVHAISGVDEETQSRMIVSIGTIKSGSSHNIIPEKIHISGTIRTQHPDARQKVHDQLSILCQQISQPNISVSLTLKTGSPAIFNDPNWMKHVAQALHTILDDQHIQELESPNMASEDFAYYLAAMNGCFLRIGARKTSEPFIPAHNPAFYAIDESIFVGAAAFWSMVQHN